MLHFAVTILTTKAAWQAKLQWENNIFNVNSQMLKKRLLTHYITPWTLTQKKYT